MEETLPEKTNLALGTGLVTVHLFQYVVLPLYLLPQSWWWGVLLLPLGLLTPPMWALMHEAVHGVLLHGQARNDAAGRLLFILFGSPLYFLRFGHLTHHRYNRLPVDLDDACDPARDCGALRAAGYYFKLLGGTYLQELAVPLLFLMPKRVQRSALETFLGSEEPSYAKVRAQAVAHLIDDPAVSRALRADAAAIYLVFGLAFFLYGTAWWMLALALLLRGFLVSFLDNVYHYGTPVSDRRYALYLAVPVWLERYMLNFTLHYVHHLYPHVPWNRLPLLAEGRAPDDGYLHALLRQLRGPIPLDRLPAGPR